MQLLFHLISSSQTCILKKKNVTSNIRDIPSIRSIHQSRTSPGHLMMVFSRITVSNTSLRFPPLQHREISWSRLDGSSVENGPENEPQMPKVPAVLAVWDFPTEKRYELKFIVFFRIPPV